MLLQQFYLECIVREPDVICFTFPPASGGQHEGFRGLKKLDESFFAVHSHPPSQYEKWENSRMMTPPIVVQEQSPNMYPLSETLQLHQSLSSQNLDPATLAYGWGPTTIQRRRHQNLQHKTQAQNLTSNRVDTPPPLKFETEYQSPKLQYLPLHYRHNSETTPYYHVAHKMLQAQSQTRGGRPRQQHKNKGEGWNPPCFHFSSHKIC